MKRHTANLMFSGLYWFRLFVTGDVLYLTRAVVCGTVSCPGVCVASRIAHHCEAALDVPGACAEDQRCCVPQDLFDSDPAPPPEFVPLDGAASVRPEGQQREPAAPRPEKRPGSRVSSEQLGLEPGSDAGEPLETQQQMQPMEPRPPPRPVSTAQPQSPQTEGAPPTDRQATPRPQQTIQTRPPSQEPGQESQKRPPKARKPSPSPARPPPPSVLGPGKPARLSGEFRLLKLQTGAGWLQSVVFE